MKKKENQLREKTSASQKTSGDPPAESDSIETNEVMVTRMIRVMEVKVCPERKM